jgi:hypothetical protein
VGVGWIVHEVPFHCSASPETRVLFDVNPTAVQAVVDVHDTAERLLESAPVGSGVGWTVHRLPSHASTRV